MAAPIVLVGCHGQVATALQRIAPAMLQRPLLAVGCPQLDLARPDFAPPRSPGEPITSRASRG